jgi:hypothetical protein
VGLGAVGGGIVQVSEVLSVDRSVVHGSEILYTG